jgi:adenylate cyclase class IV
MEKVQDTFSDMKHAYSESQKNHYFEGGSLEGLSHIFSSLVGEQDRVKLADIQSKAKSFSVRTRGTSTQTIIVVKATVNDESSSNGTARIEWEVDLFPMTLEEIDQKAIESGFSYQAKWSREREGYVLNADTVLCLDKNAGYGYLVEFERVIDDPSLVEATRAELLSMIESLGYAELDQARLARMFDFYNKNWRDYYGTEKVFTIE